MILTGDFNCTARDSALITLTEDQGFRTTQALSDRPAYGSRSTFNGFNPETPPGEAIDFILIKGQATVGRHGVISDRWDGRYVSDHNAVLADITLR